MIEVNSDIKLDEKELKLKFIRASGPGGQNVNKVSSAVQLRFDVENSPALTDDIRRRLIVLAGNRINENGILNIESRRFRTQILNRQDAVDKLVELIRQATVKPVKRQKTRPSKASKQRILEAKRRRSRIKQQRIKVTVESD
jgi:ribosome-associated protein